MYLRFKNIFAALAIVVALLCTFSAYGQEGEWVYPPDLDSTTILWLDSLVEAADSIPRHDQNVNYDSLGRIILWNGISGPKITGNKDKIIYYKALLYGWLKTEVQYDTLMNIKDYEIHTPVYNLSGDELWSDTIDVDVIDSTEIVINSPVDVTAEIYHLSNGVEPPIDNFSVEGTGNDENYEVELENGKKYIIAFINDEDEIVCVRRIEV